MPNAVTPDRYAVNRQYKSSIFAMLFGGEKELLELYNAINGTSYTDPSLLRVNTLENDVSFLMSGFICMNTSLPGIPICPCGICSTSRIFILR